MSTVVEEFLADELHGWDQPHAITADPKRPDLIWNRLGKWEVWAVTHRGEKVLAEQLMTRRLTHRSARHECKVLYGSGAILAETLRSLGPDGRMLWTDFEVRHKESQRGSLILQTTDLE